MGWKPSSAGQTAVSGGTHPASRVHPRAIAVGRLHGLDLTAAQPRLAADVIGTGDLVIAVCDRAYEDLDNRPVHWSIPDPATTEEPEAFDDPEIKLLSELADDVGFGIEALRTREDRERTADALQASENLHLWADINSEVQGSYASQITNLSVAQRYFRLRKQ